MEGNYSRSREMERYSVGGKNSNKVINAMKKKKQM